VDISIFPKREVMEKVLALSEFEQILDGPLPIVEFCRWTDGRRKSDLDYEYYVRIQSVMAGKTTTRCLYNITLGSGNFREGGDKFVMGVNREVAVALFKSFLDRDMLLGYVGEKE
jgi:hypothetical protein